MFTGERAAVPIPPPPETEWYHGRLDRYSAEQRLKAAYKLGSYLGERFVNICLTSELIFSFLSLTYVCPDVQLEKATESQEAMC